MSWYVPVCAFLLELFYNHESKSDQLILLLKSCYEGLVQIYSFHFRQSCDSLAFQNILFHGIIEMIN